MRMGASGDRAIDAAAVFDSEVEFRRWYEAAVPRVFGYLHGRCGGDPALAEELTQQTFEAAIRDRAAFDGRADLMTWLLAIARHRLIDHFRRVEREERRHLRLIVREVAVQGDDDASFRSHDERAEVRDTLRGLPAAQRAALVLHHVDGLSVHETAALMGRSPAAVESLLARGRERFRLAWKEAGRG
jgi:RNA polymerase sigma-70 factor (ECF subfamily)